MYFSVEGKFFGTGKVLRNEENQNQADRHRKTHAQQPHPRFAHFRPGVVNKVSYDNIR